MKDEASLKVIVWQSADSSWSCNRSIHIKYTIVSGMGIVPMMNNYIFEYVDKIWTKEKVW
jgi:hypothetical protein